MNVITPLLSFVMCVRDESPHVRETIEHLKGLYDEFVWFDTGSADDTPTICAQYGWGVRWDIPPESMDFGAAKTLVSALARGQFILLLDADERLTHAERLPQMIEELSLSRYQAFAFPRRRWADLAMTKQLEVEAYPDWQPRLYRNIPGLLRWTGILHEQLNGEHKKVDYGPVIEHFQDPLHLSSSERAYRRWRQRRVLARRAGVPMEGSAEAERLATVNIQGEITEVSTEAEEDQRWMNGAGGKPVIPHG